MVRAQQVGGVGEESTGHGNPMMATTLLSPTRPQIRCVLRLISRTRMRKRSALRHPHLPPRRWFPHTSTSWMTPGLRHCPHTQDGSVAPAWSGHQEGQSQRALQARGQTSQSEAAHLSEWTEGGFLQNHFFPGASNPLHTDLISCYSTAAEATSNPHQGCKGQSHCRLSLNVTKTSWNPSTGRSWTPSRWNIWNPWPKSGRKKTHVWKKMGHYWSKVGSCVIVNSIQFLFIKYLIQ